MTHEHVNQNEELQKKADEYLNNWKRAAADLINYKKEEAERMQMLAQYSREAMILKMLPIIDHIYLAERQIPENLRSDTWVEGFKQIQRQIEDFLKKEGIEEIETIGKNFDPATMEAVDQAEGGDEGTIVEELQKGYKMGDRVLRPARVKITK